MNDIEKLITDEKYNLELKEQISFEEPKKYLKAVSSFANGYDIGYVIFGVEDGTKRIVGVKDIKKSYEEIANRIKTRIDPSIIPTIDIVNIQGKDLIVVKVIPGQHTPYYYVNKGTRIAYIRKGDQDCETNSTELNELILRGRNQGWDELVTDNLYKDFTFEKLKKYFKDIKDYKIEKEQIITINPNSFLSLICVKGKGTVQMVQEKEETLPFQMGDSIFIPAREGKLLVTGQCELVVTHV